MRDMRDSGDHVSCVREWSGARGQASLTSIVIIRVITVYLCTLDWSVMTIISITRHGITNVAEFPTYFRDYYVATDSAIIFMSCIQKDLFMFFVQLL